MSKILLLEDDANLNDTVTEFLEEQGYEVISVFDGFEAQEKLYESKYDLLLLDVNTPLMNGFEVLQEARANGIVAPAIYMTSLDGIDDLEKGFASGCDDYIRKPFVLKELHIRIDTLLKRAFFHQEKSLVEIAPHIAYDIKNAELLIHGTCVSLGGKEAKLLKLFLKNEGEVLSHERINSQVWDFDETPSDTGLRTYIKNLRKRIGKDCIVSIKKQGYKFIAQK